MKKGIYLGIIWAFIAWIPLFTDHLTSFKKILCIPANFGINIELFLGFGDAFVYSILLGALIGFMIETFIKIFYLGGIKIIGLRTKKPKKLKRKYDFRR